MFGELLEKFEDIFKSVSDDEMEKRIEEMDDEELGTAMMTIVHDMKPDHILEMHESMSNTSIIEVALGRMQGMVEMYDDFLKHDEWVDLFRKCLEIRKKEAKMRQ